MVGPLSPQNPRTLRPDLRTPKYPIKTSYRQSQPGVPCGSRRPGQVVKLCGQYSVSAPQRPGRRVEIAGHDPGTREGRKSLQNQPSLLSPTQMAEVEIKDGERVRRRFEGRPCRHPRRTHQGQLRARLLRCLRMPEMAKALETESVRTIQNRILNAVPVCPTPPPKYLVLRERPQQRTDAFKDCFLGAEHIRRLPDQGVRQSIDSLPHGKERSRWGHEIDRGDSQVHSRVFENRKAPPLKAYSPGHKNSSL